MDERAPDAGAVDLGQGAHDVVHRAAPIMAPLQGYVGIEDRDRWPNTEIDVSHRGSL
jgi:hypothetical protein